MLWAVKDEDRIRATPGSRAECPGCRSETIAKCGRVKVWHWAHKSRDCDPWWEPETEWHVGWKELAPEAEVVMRRNGETHRADIVTGNGVVVELQSSYLEVAEIEARERFYGGMVWLYRASKWRERIHVGERWCEDPPPGGDALRILCARINARVRAWMHPCGFWWKSGARSLTHIRKPLYWDCEDGLIRRVSLSLVSAGVGGGYRVVGKLQSVGTKSAFVEWLWQSREATS